MTLLKMQLGEKGVLQGSNMRNALLTVAAAFLLLSSCWAEAFPRNIAVPCVFSGLNQKPKGLSLHSESSSPCALHSKHQLQMLIAAVQEDITTSSSDKELVQLNPVVRPAAKIADSFKDLGLRASIISREREDVGEITTSRNDELGGLTIDEDDCLNPRNRRGRRGERSCGRKLAQNGGDGSYHDSDTYMPYDNKDSQLLLTLKHALNDTETKVLENWNFTIHPHFCNWTGIECDRSDQYVVAIRLPGQRLSGYLPYGLAGLLNLNTLDLSNNRISGYLPTDLVNASVLVYLDLSNNFFTGEIPAFGRNTQILETLSLTKNRLRGRIPSSLGECLELRNINFNRNKLRGSIPSELGSLTKLETLYLNGNKLSGTMPSSLGNCKSLQALDVGWNQITGVIPDEYEALEALEGLYLYGNSINGSIPDWLASLRSLSYLHLYANEFSGEIPQALGDSKVLQSINLSNNSLIGVIPSSLGNSPYLFELDISVNNLTGSIPPELASLENLKELRLERNQLTRQIPPAFSDSVNLITIALSNNQLSGQIFELDKLKNLRRLSLEENRLNGSIPKSVTLCTNLFELNLSRNSLTGPIPDALGDLTGLAYLGLSDNELIGSLPDSLTLCTGLQYLLLSNNAFEGSLPVDVGFLDLLVYVDLSNNSLGGALPEGMGKLTKLQYLNLERNLLEGQIPESLENLLQLEDLRLGFNYLKGPIPSQLSSLTKLQTLTLNDNNFTASIPESLGQLQNLNVLYLHGNGLSGPIPSTLGNLTQLKDFSLAENLLTGGIPPSLLRGLSGLEANFSLGHNRLGGPIPLEVGFLAKVKSINLTSNRFNESIPDEVGHCSALVKLDLSSNELTGILPVSLGNLQYLQALNVSHNELQGSIPTGLGMLNSLVVLDLSVNNLSGSIPRSLAELSHLRFLNVSNNDLSGEIILLGSFKYLSASSFWGNPGLCGAILGKLCNGALDIESEGSKKQMWIYIGVAIGAFIILAILAVALFIWCRKPYPVGQLQVNGANRGSIIARSELFYPQLRFTAQDLKLATENFSEVNILGTGRMSRVYRGVLPELVLVAIKKLKFPSEADIPSQFICELDDLTRLRHKHLVAVLGYCFEADLNALVVQFMSNGSLEEHLHKSRDLGWAARARIAVGVAKALTYLHHECGPAVVHCDLKPSNILLDAELEPHLEDFGLSRLIFAHKLIAMSDSSLGSSVGYFPPEYLHSPTVSPKGDVYSYGIVLIEMLTGRRPSSDMFHNELTIRRWCQSFYPERTREVLDRTLFLESPSSSQSAANEKQMSQYMKVALMCTREIPEERPTMRHVLDLMR